MEDTGKLPLGIFKQAIMKIDSFIGDINEIREDSDLDPEDRETLIQMVELAGVMEATLLNMVRKEMDEEDFLNETFDMDVIEEYPDPELYFEEEYEGDVLDEII